MPDLLLFSDVHSDHDASRRLVHRAETADVVVGAGDFATPHGTPDATIEILSAIEVPTVLVPGNSESAEELQAACRDWAHAHVLHGDGIELHGIPFFGIGGGIPVTPFGAWSNDFTEHEAEELLADLPEGSVLVSHSPPKNVVDRDSRGRRLGSTALRRAIERTHPKLVVCGHIHGSWGRRERLGDTPIVNAGPEGIGWTLDSGATT